MRQSGMPDSCYSRHSWFSALAMLRTPKHALFSVEQTAIRRPFPKRFANRKQIRNPNRTCPKTPQCSVFDIHISDCEASREAKKPRMTQVRRIRRPAFAHLYIRSIRQIRGCSFVVFFVPCCPFSPLLNSKKGNRGEKGRDSDSGREIDQLISARFLTLGRVQCNCRWPRPL